MHISDCTKTRDLHFPLGCAELPFNKFFAFLKEIDYSGIILQEIKPRGLELNSVMDSNLHCVAAFSRKRFLALQLRYAFLRPVVTWGMKQVAKTLLNKGQSLLVQDLAFDYSGP